MEEIEILIDPDGNTHIHVKGSRGNRCLKVTDKLEEALGEVTERVFCPEYYEEPEKIVLQDKTHQGMKKSD